MKDFPATPSESLTPPTGTTSGSSLDFYTPTKGPTMVPPKVSGDTTSPLYDRGLDSGLPDQPHLPIPTGLPAIPPISPAHREYPPPIEANAGEKAEPPEGEPVPPEFRQLGSLSLGGEAQPTDQPGAAPSRQDPSTSGADKADPVATGPTQPGGGEDVQDSRPEGEPEPAVGAVDLAAQERELPAVLGKFFDGVHSVARTYVRDGRIVHDGKLIEVASLDAAVADQRAAFLEVNERVIAEARAACPELRKVFSPFNGGETTILGSDYTLAIDKLPIGTPNQVEALARNEFARGMYLVDKLDRGYSFSGMTHDLGYVGAMLQWDIKHIQGGAIQDIAYLDVNGNNIDDPDMPAAGIRLTYTTADDLTRIHEQYSSESADPLEHVRERLAEGGFDGLYIRGAEHLVTMLPFAAEYRSYVQAVRSGGIVVADLPLEELTWGIEDQFSQQTGALELRPGEQFGYAARDSKVRLVTGTKPTGFVTFLEKA